MEKRFVKFFFGTLGNVERDINKKADEENLAIIDLVMEKNKDGTFYVAVIFETKCKA